MKIGDEVISLVNFKNHPGFTNSNIYVGQCFVIENISEYHIHINVNKNRAYPKEWFKLKSLHDFENKLEKILE